MLLTNSFLGVTLSLMVSMGPVQPNENDTFEDRLAKGSELMGQVFHQFHINYEMSRTHKLGFYQEAMQDTKGVHYLAESIVDIYVPHNLSNAEHAAIKPIRSRKKVYEKINADDLLFGGAGDMARCSIWRPNSFLSEKNRDNYRFVFSGDSLFKNLRVHVVDFYPANTKGKVKGTMLIDQVSKAILHIDYIPEVRNSKLWSKVTWIEEFYFVEGKYELSKVVFKGLCSKNTFEYNATLVMQHLRVLSKLPEESSFLGKEKSVFHHSKNDFSDEFWSGYQNLRADVESEHVLHVASN